MDKKNTKETAQNGHLDGVKTTLGQQLSKEENAMLRALYIRQAKLAQEMKNNERTIGSLIKKRFGFHYSKADLEPIIDTLDYGSNNLSYKGFIDLMNEAREEIIEGDRKFNP